MLVLLRWHIYSSLGPALQQDTCPMAVWDSTITTLKLDPRDTVHSLTCIKSVICHIWPFTKLYHCLLWPEVKLLSRTNKTDSLLSGLVNDNKMFGVLVEKCYLFSSYLHLELEARTAWINTLCKHHEKKNLKLCQWNGAWLGKYSYWATLFCWGKVDTRKLLVNKSERLKRSKGSCWLAALLSGSSTMLCENPSSANNCVRNIKQPTLKNWEKSMPISHVLEKLMSCERSQFWDALC